VIFAWLTGLRQGELFALRDRAVDLAAGIVVVTRAAYKGRAAQTKTRRSVRRVYLSGLAKQTLREQQIAREPTAESLVEVAAELGHKDARLVFQQYGHLYRGAAEAAVRRLDRLTGGTGVGEAWARRASSVFTAKAAVYSHGACGDRTRDLRLAKPALSQLS
jgi:hypothetical protein